MATLGEFVDNCNALDSDHEAEEIDENDDCDWSFLSAEQLEPFVLSENGTDDMLLSTAVLEIKALCRNARQIFNKATNDEISLSNIANYFLESVVAPIFSAIVEGSQDSSDISGTDLVQFIKTLAFLSLYRTTPTTFFKPVNGFLYPVASTLSAPAFKRVLKALKRKRNCANGGTWDAPFSVDPLIRTMEQNLTVVSCKMAYIRGISIISIDDDQYRLTSAMSEWLGLARINNPKKAFGVVSTNAVSLTTSIVLGMRLAGKGEGFGEIAQIVLMWMQSVGLPNQVQGRLEFVAMDRGYMLPSLVEYLCQQGFNLIGTYKRIKSAPFSFGVIPASGRRKHIEETGAKSIYVARKRFSGRWIYSIAYRGGKGRVAMLITTEPRANTWIFTPRRVSEDSEEFQEHPLIQQAVGDLTEPLTSTQGRSYFCSIPPCTNCYPVTRS
jgi:hypothetical protein